MSQALVETVRLRDGGTAYQIIARDPGDVQAEIDRLVDMVDDTGGEAHFENPHRAYSCLDGLKRWRSRGFVRVAR